MKTIGKTIKQVVQGQSGSEGPGNRVQYACFTPEVRVKVDPYALQTDCTHAKGTSWCPQCVPV